jgi:hypothetical protein
MRAQHERLSAFVFAEKVSPRTPRLFVIAAEVGAPVRFGTLVGYQLAMLLDALRGPFQKQVGGRVDERPHLDDPRNAGATDLPMTNEICAHDLPARVLAAPYRWRGLSSPAYLDRNSRWLDCEWMLILSDWPSRQTPGDVRSPG